MGMSDISGWPPLDLAVARKLIERDVARRIIAEIAPERFHSWRKARHLGTDDDAVIEDAVTFAREFAARYVGQEA